MPRLRLAIACVLSAVLLPTAAHAQVATFTSFAEWTAALHGGLSGLDTFDDLPPALSFVSSPQDRTAGPFGYQAAAPVGLVSVGPGGDRWIGTNEATDDLVFSNFAMGVNAIGGSFFRSDLDGNFVTGDVILDWVTSAGSGSVTISPAAPSEFWGLVTTGTLTSLQSRGTPNLWATANDLRVAQVPEPASLGLLAVGAVGLAAAGRRRRAART